jgi:hypothetical protein
MVLGLCYWKGKMIPLLFLLVTPFYTGKPRYVFTGDPQGYGIYRGFVTDKGFKRTKKICVVPTREEAIKKTAELNQSW